MSWKEKSALQIIFVIDNNYYLISDKRLKRILKTMRNKYQKYITKVDVMAINWFKIKTAFWEEFYTKYQDKEKRGINNILHVMNNILISKTNDLFFNSVESDIILLNNYL